jgi:hypothetical protein
MQSSTAHMERGKTYFQGQAAPAAADFNLSAQLEGVTAIFAERDTAKEGASLRKRPTGRYTKCILVRNSHANTAFGPGLAVAWEDGYRKRRVNALATAEGASTAGFVDDKLTSAGARAGDLFWLMVGGHAKVTAADAAYAVNAALGVGAAGVADADASPDIYTVAHVTTAATVSSGLPLLEVDLCMNH